MREMKKSHIPFCEYIPNTWNEMPNRYLFESHSSKVGDRSGEYQLLSLTTSGVKKKDPDSGGGKVPESYDNYQTVEKGDIVFCLFDLDVSAVFSGLSKLDGMITSAYDVFRARHKYVDDHYLDYWFQYVFSNRHYKMFSKNIRYTITGEMFKSIYTPVPSIEKQCKIGALLDRESEKIDALIANQEAQIEKLKQYKQSLITEVVTKGLDPDAPMKDSGIEWIGVIPKDYIVIGISHILDKSHPYPFGDGDHGLIKPDDYTTSGVPYIRVQNLGWGTELLTDNMVFISKERNEMIKNSTLRPNDVLFAKTGATIGKTGIIPTNMPIANTTSHVGKITVSPKYYARYIFYVLTSFIGYRQFWEIACQKTTRPELAINEMKAIKLVIPRSLDKQKMIVEALDKKSMAVDRLIEIKEQKINRLVNMKKSLIYEYVTGKKEV